MSAPGYPPQELYPGAGQPWGSSQPPAFYPQHFVNPQQPEQQAHTAWVPSAPLPESSGPAYAQAAPLYPPPLQHQQQYAQAAYVQGFGQPAQGPDQGLPIPGLNAPALNPLTFMAAGNNFFQGSRQYVQQVQQKMGWLSGGALNYYFAVSPHYVSTKLLILISPFLKKWTYSRQPEQIQGAHKYRPPRLDANAPDLYLPLVSAWAYVMLLALNAMLLGKYRPDVMYAMVWYASVAWLVHGSVASAVLWAMSLPTSMPWAELCSYTGYSFVYCCLTLVAGMLGGRWAWRGMYLYTALCSAVFLVRTMKRVLFQEARSYGANITLINYLLLGLAVWQFPFILWMCNVTLPQASLFGVASHALRPPAGKAA